MEDSTGKAIAISYIQRYLHQENSNQLKATIMRGVSKGSLIHIQLYETLKAIEEKRYDDADYGCCISLMMHLEGRNLN